MTIENTTTNGKSTIVRKAIGHLEVRISDIIVGANVRETFNPKTIDDLAANIEEVGLLQPLVVEPAEEADKFRLVSGARRLRAVTKLGWKTVPVTVTKADGLAHVRQIAENAAREDVPPIELARALSDLVSKPRGKDKDGEDLPAYSRDEAAKLIGMSKSHLANMVRVYQKCSPVVLDAWKKHPENIPIKFLIGISALDHADQDARLEDFLGGLKFDSKPAKRAKGEGSGEGDGEEGEGNPRAHKGRKKGEVQDAVFKLMTAGKLSAADEGKLTALFWVLGDVATLDSSTVKAKAKWTRENVQDEGEEDEGSED